VAFTLGEISQIEEQRYYGTAVKVINQLILSTINDRGIIGVLVVPSEKDLDPATLKDLRRDKTTLAISIYAGHVTEARTLAAGKRVPVEARVNNPMHQRILDRSPVQPESTATEGQTSLVRKDLLDDYLFRLNRHPGRRVDVAVSRGEEEGGVALDYLVSENKPWMMYYQISNTGTETTHEWRNRFGFTHNQLFDNDDNLTMEYITAGDFDSVHALVGSYEAPVFDSESLRWKIDGSWGDFDASEIGFADEEFSGDDWRAGFSLLWNIYQQQEFFVDMIGGVAWHNITVSNQTFGTGTSSEGDQDFFLGNFGFQAERKTDTATTRGLVQVEWNNASVSDTEEGATELDLLQRIDADKDFVVLKWAMTHSMYLEPLFNRSAWEDVTTPDTSTLAHEAVFIVRGQYTFDDARLVPRKQDVVGGLYSVRGYPESLSAGDTVFVGSAEDRFHLPRALAINPDPTKTQVFGKPFRWTPQQVYGGTDWDLIMRAFIDAGYTIDNDSSTTQTEGTEALVGAGLGLELVLKQNLSLRADWGVALKDVDGDDPVTSGAQQWHLVMTLFY
jgi:hypothetical protein